MSCRPLLRWSAVLLLLAPLAGCARDADDGPAPAVTSSLPDTPGELAALLLTEVPSGLPRVPDGDLTPPAGAKTLRDVAGYADDPPRERQVLADYGYQRGWERFWGADGPQTTVFVDQFSRPEGAAAYALDLAHNDAAYYEGDLATAPTGMPEGCRSLTVRQPHHGLDGPAAFAWCTKGVFSVGVSAVSTSPEAATAEMRAVVAAQLARLPG